MQKKIFHFYTKKEMITVLLCSSLFYRKEEHRRSSFHFISLFLEQEQITKLIPKKTMKLTFRIRYRTVWGENLRIILNEEENNSIPLTTRDLSLIHISEPTRH